MALKLVQNNEIDNFKVIMLDIEMPVMDGIECMKKIREHFKQKKTECPIIAAVTANDIYKHKKYKEMGFDFVAEKPVKEE